MLSEQLAELAQLADRGDALVSEDGLARCELHRNPRPPVPILLHRDLNEG
jgi:hypothetical protein